MVVIRVCTGRWWGELQCTDHRRLPESCWVGFRRKERSALSGDRVRTGPVGLCKGRASKNWCRQGGQEELCCQRVKCKKKKEVKEVGKGGRDGL